MSGQRIKINDPLAHDYLDYRATVVCSDVVLHDRSVLNTFYRWLEKRSLTLQDVDRQMVKKFISANGWAVITAKHHRYTLRCYFRWLHKYGHITRDDNDLIKPKLLLDKDLPHLANEYQKFMKSKWRCQMSFSRSKYILYHFHRWIDRRQITLSRLENGDVKKFVAGLVRKGRKPLYVLTLRRQLSLYLDWLSDKGLTKCDFKGVLPTPRGQSAKNLTQVAKAYLTALASVRQVKTISSYKSTLAVFHTFLLSRNVTIQTMTRVDMLAWMQDLYARGLKPSSRKHFIIHVRLYLSWLYEYDHLKKDPHTFIQLRDLPKRPKLLPRPLPPDVDAEIVRRLEWSHDIYARGLLLMRLTGIRVGELHTLPFNCMLRDFNGNVSLKVPLGKLNSERMVPIDQRVVDIINGIQDLAQDYSFRAGKRLKCQYLITDPTGKAPNYSRFSITLKSISQNIETVEPIVTHRLRHTYASSLLNAGMSIFAVMRILGHRDITSTLIYAAVTLDMVRREYSGAQQRIDKQYEIKPLAASPDKTLGPSEALEHALKLLRKSIERGSDTQNRKLALLEKRMARLKSELTEIMELSPQLKGPPT